MKKEELEKSIAQITEAIKLIMECKGYGYGAARLTTKTMIEERSRMEKELKRLGKVENA